MDNKTTVKLARGSLFYGLGNFLPLLANVLLLPFFTHYLTPNDYGLISAAEVTTRAITILVLLGLPNTLIRFYYKYRDNPTQFRNSIGWHLRFAVLLAVVILSVLFASHGVWVNWFFPGDIFYPILAMALITAGFGIFLPVLQSWYQAKNEYKKHLLVTQANFFLTALLTVYLVGWLKLGAVGGVLAVLIGSVLMGLYSLLVVWPYLRISKQGQINWDSVKFGIPLIPEALAIWLLVFIDRVLIARIMGFEAVGIYAIGYSAGAVMSLIVSSTQKAWLPLFLKSDDNTRLPIIITTYLAIISFIGLAGALFVKDGFALIINERYLEGAIVVAPVILGYIFYGLYFISVNTLLKNDRTAWMAGLSGLAAITNIALNIWWIPRYGILGAAMATGLSYVVLYGSTLLISQRRYPIANYPYFSIFSILGLGFLAYWGANMLGFIWYYNIAIWLGYAGVMHLLRIIDLKQIHELISSRKQPVD